MRPIVHQMPADFRKHMHETYDDLMGRYEVSENTIRRWIAETGIKRSNRVQQKGCGNAPPGFALASKHMDLTSLCTRYSVSADVIRRWKRETDVPLRNDRVVATSTFERAHIDTSVLLRAVAHLQKERAVSRRNADGLHDLSGRYWLCGKELLDEAGVIALAKRRGFNADAWKRVAA